MNSAARLKRSRDNWKKKAVPRRIELALLRKDKERLRQAAIKKNKLNASLMIKIKEAELNNAALQAEITRIKSESIALQSSPSGFSPDLTQLNLYSQTRALCVMLVVAGALSFRSVPRALGILQESGWIPVCRLPHFTSIINWTLRSGIAVYKDVTTLNEPWFGIVDCSIDIGIRKALVVLRVPLSVVQSKNGAIGLDDCECIGLKVSTVWNGELVEKELADVFDKGGKPIAIIKDQGSDLSKGIRLYNEKNNGKNKYANEISVIDDVGHFAANALKAEFSQTTDFKRFLELVNTGSAKIRQTEMAHLLPPKIRSKGRFQGITKLSNWAGKILNLLSAICLSKQEDPQSKLWDAFHELLDLQIFLERFVEIGSTIESFLALMKHYGLNQNSYIKAKSLLEKLPKKSIVRVRLEGWLSKHLEIQNLLGLKHKRLLVSDDVIESLFGRFKVLVQRSPRAELNRLVYVLPLLCGNHNRVQVVQAIGECSQMEMVRYLADNIPTTLRQQRDKTFDSLQSRVPKTGKLLSSGQC